MYEYDNQTDRSGGASDTGSGSEYRYSGPFYQDNTGSDGRGRDYKNIGEVSPKKKKGFGRTVVKAVCLALVFGIVAGVAFQGTNYLGGKLFENDKTVASGSSKEKREGFLHACMRAVREAFHFLWKQEQKILRP